MDKTTPVKEDSSEVTRELLIAISDVPDKLQNSTPVHENTPNGTEVTEEDSADKLRSELISISYVPSPDKISLPIPGARED